MEPLTPRRRLIESMFGILGSEELSMDTDETYAVLVELIGRLDGMAYRGHVDPRRRRETGRALREGSAKINDDMKASWR